MSDDASMTMFNMDAVIAPRQIQLIVDGDTVHVDSDQTPYTIGRDPNSVNLCINSEYSSRTHCTIKFENRNFCLIDNSTNGTHVRIGANPPIKLQGNSTTLTGTGGFKLGEAIKVGDTALIQYKIVF
jgi:pSer/pThr/pTyr-binding forkhead associated (FHA) protein